MAIKCPEKLIDAPRVPLCLDVLYKQGGNTQGGRTARFLLGQVFTYMVEFGVSGIEKLQVNISWTFVANCILAVPDAIQ